MESDPHEIRVDVDTSYSAEQSDPEEKRCYQMAGDDGEQVDAPVAAFRLALPGLLH